MKLARTTLSDLEYRLLVKYAEKHKLTIKATLRKAVLELVMPDKVYPDDRIFANPETAPGSGRNERVSEERDRILYGGPAETKNTRKNRRARSIFGRAKRVGPQSPP